MFLVLPTIQFLIASSLVPKVGIIQFLCIFQHKCQHLRPRQCIGGKVHVIELGAEYSLAHHTLLRRTWFAWLEAVVAASKHTCSNNVLVQPVYPGPQLPPLRISILCTQLLNQSRPLAWLYKACFYSSAASPVAQW